MVTQMAPDHFQELQIPGGKNDGTDRGHPRIVARQPAGCPQGTVPLLTLYFRFDCDFTGHDPPGSQLTARRRADKLSDSRYCRSRCSAQAYVTNPSFVARAKVPCDL